MHRLVTAETVELLLLEHPQHLTLRQGGKVGDLIEEQGPARALLELADPLPVSAGERPALVAEKLAFEQGLRYSSAVDRQERTGCSPAVLIKRRATSSLPVPLSPLMSTVSSCAATRPITLYTSCIAGQRPMMTSARSSIGSSSPVTTAGTCMSRLMAAARSTSCLNGASSNGLNK